MPSDPMSEKERELERLRNADMPEDDREAIEEAVSETADSPNTFATYIGKLRLLGEHAEYPLVEHDSEALEDLLQRLAEDRGWSDGTRKIYDSAAVALANYLDLDETPSVAKTDKKAIDVRTVLTPEDFFDVRESVTSVRDRALVDFLGFTGQRIRVAQLLRIRDVDVENSIWFMPEGEGKKGADERGNKRPLLAAQQSMAEWLELHPTGDPDDFIFTAKAQGPGEPGTMMTQTALRDMLSRAGDRADVDKPTNPHAFRHHFVSTAKTRYDMEDSTVKHIIGHREESQVMNTTYKHLSDDYHVQEARESLGLDEEENTEDMAPPVCPDCQTPLRPSVDECPTAGCDERFTDTHTQEDELVALAQEIEQKQERFEELAESLDMDV